MNTFVFLQQAPAAGAGGGLFGSNSGFLIMMVLLFVVMYFFMIRPQQKKQKEIKKMRDAMQKGDKVITAGGVYGTIVEVNAAYFLIEIDSNVKVRIDRNMVFKDSSDLQQAR